MHIFALSISVMVTTAGNGARFCATSAPKIGPRKCFILTLRRLSVVHRNLLRESKTYASLLLIDGHRAQEQFYFIVVMVLHSSLVPTSISA